jgi:hypothetical protein
MLSLSGERGKNEKNEEKKIFFEFVSSPLHIIEYSSK